MANKFCANCGLPLKGNEAFCASCGASADFGRTAPAPATPPAGNYVPPIQPTTPPSAGHYTQPIQNNAPPPAGNYPPPAQPYYAPPQPRASPAPVQYAPAQAAGPQTKKRGGKTGLLIAGICVGAVLLVAVIVIALFANPTDGMGDKPAVSGAALTDADLPGVAYSYLTRQKTVEVDFVVSETIYPSLYSTMDSVVNLNATSEGGETEALVKVEIPGFTQPFEQKVTLGSQITKLYIKPALLPGYIDLTSSKDAQINISVLDNDTGKVYVQETRKVKLMSVYDFILWEDDFGEYNKYNVLAWLTPESEGILALRRTAIAWLEDYSGGMMNSLPGYQLALYGEDEYYLNVIWQVVAIQAAMSELGMRYNMGSFSMTEGYNQRVLLPDSCLETGSGVCIETALIMASAIQSANMHAMIIFPPGHAQVAIEDWNESGEYWLIETTLLPFGATDDELYSFVTYYDNEQWLEYIADPWGDGSGPCFVVDCDMAAPLGITAFSN